MDPPSNQEDLFPELSPEAIRSADEAIAQYLATCECTDKSKSPTQLFLSGEYQSPSGVMTSPMKYTRFQEEPSALKVASKESHHENGSKMTSETGDIYPETGGDAASKRKLSPAKPSAPTPSSQINKMPPLKRSSIPAESGKYVQNGTTGSSRARVKKPIPKDALILTIDSDSEEENRKMPPVKKESVLPSHSWTATVVKTEKVEKKATVPHHQGSRITVDKNNNTTVSGGYEDWQINAAKREMAEVYRDVISKHPPPPPDGCSFLPAARLQVTGRTAESAAAVSKQGSVQSAASASFPGVMHAMKSRSFVTATPATAKHAPPSGRVERQRRKSKKPIEVATSSSSSESESEEETSSEDSMEMEFSKEEQAKLEQMGPYARAIYKSEIKKARRVKETAARLKDKFVKYSKAPLYNGSSKENKAPNSYLARKKKEWKKKEAQAQVRHILKKEEKKSNKIKKKPGRSKSLGPSLKLGEWPQFWSSDSMFHARATRNPGASGVHSTLLDGAGSTPDYRIPALNLKSSDRASKQRVLQAMKVPALKLLVAMTKSTLAQDKTLLYHFVDVNASKEADPPTPVENCVAALIATLVDLYMD
ncbi:unknown protein [Seminavis robusta]|uniref:Uncharacterized protein n=1 Tax=Seminavis robusta TaxID=568900 RepID=A0A9N8HLK1_9STRA|nr:unknown protein [Seminavis robusta]|eukprot:Sro922_g220600.1 n/a (594) ;mRNA; f:28481-30373